MAATTHEPGVPLDDAALGVAAAGVLIGALPVYAFYLLGRALAHHRITLGVLCVASTVPIAFFYFLGWVLVLATVLPAGRLRVPVVIAQDRLQPEGPPR